MARAKSQLTSAKRLSHQLGQLEYQEGSPAVPPQDYQKLQEAIAAIRVENVIGVKVLLSLKNRNLHSKSLKSKGNNHGAYATN